jgi:cytochrome c556
LLQTQLIELRTKNYELQEQKTKRDAEYQQLLDKYQSTNKELEKASKNLQKSKKAKEFQLLVEENESLQKRLYQQEEDFKLQNKTLMDEIGKVYEEREHLKKSARNEKDSPELNRLKVENSTLQKSLQILKDQLNSDDSNSENVGAINEHLAAFEEEKLTLQRQVEELEEKRRSETEELQSKIDMLEEKIRKKQEILLEVQNEKEQQIIDSKLVEILL